MGNDKVPLAESRVGRIYLAGPMTGIEDYNFPAFNKEAAALREKGFEVINPADHGIVEGAEWEDYLRYDLAKLVACEGIHFLPGWEMSRGARLEYKVAQALSMKITYAETPEFDTKWFNDGVFIKTLLKKLGVR